MKSYHVLTLLNTLILVILVVGFLNLSFEFSEQYSKSDLMLQKIRDEFKSIQQNVLNDKNQLTFSESQYNLLLQEIENRDIYNRKILNEKSTKSEAKKLNNKLEDVDFKASDFSQVIKDSMPAVVKITVKIHGKLNENLVLPFEQTKTALKQKGIILDKLNDEENTLPVIGSGVFIRKGLVLTNRHVANAEEDVCNDEFTKQFFTCTGHATIEVVTANGETSIATINKLSNNYDLALLQTELKEKTLSLSKSGVSQGEEIVALGNPLDNDFSATKGIVSAVDRDLGDGLGNFWVQTDTPINEGNSGGPLINKNGDVVGIATLKLGGLFMSTEGLGFAIPSRIIREEFFG